MNRDEPTLRSLIRLIPPAEALKDQLEKSIHLETYAATGDLAIRSLVALQSSVSQLTNDPYIAALAPVAPEGASDREKVSLALLSATQLLAYLEGETGLASGRGHGKTGSIQTAPNISLNNVEGVPNIERVFDTLPERGGKKPAE